MKPKIVLTIALATIVVVGAFVFYSLAKNVAPVFAVESVIDVGVLAVGESVPFAIEIANSTDHDFSTEEVKVSCGCIVELPDKNVIKGKSKSSIAGIFVAEDISVDKVFSRLIVISFEDKSLPLIPVELRARVVRGVSSQDTRLMFGKDGSTVKPLLVTRQFLHGVKFKQLAPSQHPSISWQAEFVSEDLLSISGKIKHGGLNGYSPPLELEFRNNAEVIERYTIPVVFQEDEELALLTPLSCFQVVERSSLGEGSVQDFQLDSKLPLMRILDVAAKNNPELIHSKIGANKKRFSVTLNEKAKKGVLSDELLVTILDGDTTKKVRRPVTFIIR